MAECAPPPEPTGDNHPQAAQGDPVTGVQGEAAPSGRTEDETPAVPPMCDGNAGVKNAAVLPTDSAGGATSGATTPVLSLDATAEVLVPAPGRSSASQAPADEHNPTLDALRDRVAIFAVLERFATRRFCENLAALVPGKGLPTVLASINAAAAELDARNRVAGACPDPVEAARFVLGHCRSFQPRPTGGDESHLGDDVRALLGDLRAADGLADVADVDTAERIDRARERDGGARLSLAATRAAIASAVEKVCPKSPGPRRLRAALESFVQSQRDFEPGPEAELATDDERAALGAWRRAVIDAGKPEPKLFPEDFEGIRSLAGHARRLAKAAAREPSFRRPKRRSMGVASSGRKHAYWPPLEAFRGPDEDASFGLTLPRLATDFVSRAGDDVRARGLNPRPPKYDWQGQLGWVPSLAHGLGDDRRRDDLVPAERARLALENLSAVRTARDAAEALAWLLEGPAPIFAPRAEIEAERDRAAEAAQVGPPSAWQEPEMWARRRSDPRAPSNVDRVPAAMNGWSEIELRALSPRSTLRSVGQPTPALSARGRAIADALGAAVGGPPDEPVAQLWAEVLGPDGPTDDAAVFVARRRALGGFVLSGGGHHAGDARAWWYALPAKERGLKTRAFDADVAAEPLPGDEDGLDAAGRAALETMRAAGLRFATPARAARLAGLLGGAPAHLLAWACRRAPDNADALDAELERLLDLHESGVTFDAPEGPPPPERAPRANPDRPNRFVVPRLTPALGPVPTAAEVRARLAALPPAAPPPAPEGTEVEAYDEGAEAGEHGWADDVDPPAPRARLESGVYLRSGEELAPPEAAEALAAS
ncbi:MAG TPA: hypothetical protein VFS00_16905 [Polyangiaceae bacterium]|nr:hypothetical protein [Polyangiaceae bacterium]